MRNLVYYVATSMDGFIADADGDFSAFPVPPETLADLFARYPETCPVQARAALGVDAAPVRFDTVIMGRRTAEPALAAGLSDGAYPHLRQIVVTRGEMPPSARLETMSGDVLAGVSALKAEPGRDIWLCGGGELAAAILPLIDEVQLKVNPILLGDGVPLVRGGGLQRFELAGVEAVPGGVLLVTYRRVDA